MSDERGDDRKATARQAREERLAAALRANLRRRKAAARDAPEASAETPGAAAGRPDEDPR